MIYRCPNCASALVFDSNEGRLVCKSCDSMFRPEDVKAYDGNEEHIVSPEDVDADDYDLDFGSEYTGDGQADDMPKRMKCHIFTCTSCGAEVMLNDVEAATFCVYCGQPTVVFSRVSDEWQPDYILPFKINRDVVKTLLRLNLRKRFFVPRAIKNTQMDTLRGIYVPFWLYNLEYYDKQYYLVTVKTLGGLREEKRGYYKEAKSNFLNMAVNASHVLADEEIQSLEPFYMDEMVPFSPGYLSGFYADRFDMDKGEVAGKAVERAQVCFDKDTEMNLYKRGKNTPILCDRSPKVTFNGAKYALLPVWFLTLRYRREVYTLLVNGQTGKLMGNLPVNKGKAFVIFVLLTLLFAIPFGALGIVLYLSFTQQALATVFMAVPVYLLFFLSGIAFGKTMMKHLKHGIKYTKSNKIHRFVKERQELS